jgi:DNA polymerase III subunit epsilon
VSGSANAPLSGVELRPSGTLVERALACLADGPLATPHLAERVLALRGNPKAAAAAVFALLGTDPRFEVDRAGIWSLAAAPDTFLPVLLRAQEWVVVDVETTGGSPAHGHRVIEIAAVQVVGGRIAGQYATLVNPGRAIPRMITSLTGIDDRAVADAPRFEEIATAVADALRGRVFVGHNASFDWAFVSAEMERCTGRTLSGRRLCTLRLARRMLPHLPSRSLGALAEYFGIEMDAHHRALDDAAATAHLLLGFLDSLEEREVTDWAALERFFQTRPKRVRRSAKPRSVERE